MPRPLHLSASAIRAFLHCPNCFRYAYIEGIRPLLEPEQFRVGTNWHAMHEVYRQAQTDGGSTDCSPFDLAIATLNAAYSVVPDAYDETEWEIERITLAMCFAGHVWYYQNDTIETLATEVPFMMPIRHPKTGLPLSKDDVIVPGKIDRIVRWQGKIGIADYKSTKKSINSDSEFWSHLRLDSQISTYCLYARDLHRAGTLEQYGISKADVLSGAFYDVWHKPGISPAMLSQADSKVVAESGLYLEEPVAVHVMADQAGVVTRVQIDGKDVAFKAGAKAGTFAFTENPTMYGARLLKDIYARPEFYFCRREIPRTDLDLKKFRKELYGMYQTIKLMREGDYWYRNDAQDSMAMHGEYGPLCYQDFDPSDGSTPEGYKRLWTPGAMA